MPTVPTDPIPRRSMRGLRALLATSLVLAAPLPAAATDEEPAPRPTAVAPAPPPSAAAGARGWLDFTGGDVLAGTLLAAEPGGGGRFRSDRFGEIRFAPGEARFRAAAPPSDPARTAAATPAPEVPVPTAAPAAEPAGSGLRPDTWTIGIAADWKRENQDTEVDLNVELEAQWRRAHDEIDLRSRTDYKVRDGKVDNNEQSARLRGFHDLDTPWLLFGQLFIERHNVTISGTKIDYLLWQGTLGAGLRQRWGEHGVSRAVLGFNRFRVDLLDFGRHVNDHAPSLLIDHELQPFDRVQLRQSLVVYFWRDHSVGVDSETGLDYALTRRVSIGLTHRYRQRAVDLNGTAVNEFRLSTRFNF